MSVIIAAVTKSYSLIITDTRVTRLNPNGYDDSEIKMRYLNGYGYFACIGVGDLLQKMLNRLSSINIDNVNENLLSSFNQSYDELLSTTNGEIYLNKTAICVSWHNLKPQLRFFSKAFKSVAQDLSVNNAYIIYPDDLDEAFKYNVNTKLDKISLDNGCCLSELLSLFKEISLSSRMVSSIACIGIHKNNNDPKFFSDDVSDLLQILNSSTPLENQFKNYKDKLCNGF